MAFKRSFNNTTAGLSSVDPHVVQFLFYSDEDIKRLSVANITTPVTLDTLGNPRKSGLYDPALGPVLVRNDFCATCGNSQLHCPGHFGHIELPLLVVHPLFIKTIYSLFRITCLHCFKIQINEHKRELLTLQLKLLDNGFVTEALIFREEYCNAGSEKEENVKLTKKGIRKFKKLLNNVDPVVETFHGKNTSALRQQFLNNILRPLSNLKICIHCKNRLIKFSTSDNKIMCNEYDNKQKYVKILLPDEIKRYCAKISEQEAEMLVECIPILKTSSYECPTDMFFIQVVPVTPSNVRPINVLHGDITENIQCNIYKLILESSFCVRSILQVLSSSNPESSVANLEYVARHAYKSSLGTTAAEKLHSQWQELQKLVNMLLDTKIPGKTGLGLKQILEKKAGIIRKHMMGKRVNFAARSVITPDPNVAIDEIGVPDAFATKLTYPVPVTEWNVDELRKMVINGPNVHPGAEKIEINQGKIIRIPADSIQKRESLAKRLLTPDESNKSLKIVHRHLLNGDLMVLNRQPTLHKPSMMAHKARILTGEKTLRLHYANCKSYNADFDGDEMNAHFPQNEIARSECYNIMSVSRQYLVPKDGTPLSGLIQDHVISGVKMSLRGTFFDKNDYQQLVFQALSSYKGKIKLLPPSILKPVMLWSGKQVLSTIIINIIPKGRPYLSLSGKAKINTKAWQLDNPRKWKAGGSPFANDIIMSEAEVIVRNGELLSGVLDKTHYGATPYGLVHCMYELYGGDSSSALLSAFSKIFTFYLQWIGFTLGVKDILVVEEANKKRDEFIADVRESGKVAAAKATDLPLESDESQLKDTISNMMVKDLKFRAHLDRQYKTLLDTYTNKINTVCLSHGLLEKFPSNNLQLMVQSGAKGSTVNTMQISCLLGQIELEGKRPPLMISGRSLPSFSPYDISPRAGGFIDGRFMTGIQPQEFFFHCMAGREGLIDTAVKTSRSGYLQRCLIKHLEGLSVTYDHTVRDSDGSVIQFAYGEDGLDVLKCQFLRKEQLPFLDTNADAVILKADLKKLKNDADEKLVLKSRKSIKKWFKKYGGIIERHRMSPFSEYTKHAKNDIDLDNLPTNRTRDPYYWKLEEMWRELQEEERDAYKRKPRPDPLVCKVSPEYKFGVITEQLDELVQSYLKTRSTSPYIKQSTGEKFIDIMNAKFLASLAAPGEPVGLLAAQSIGEPSTQMTLNTFHFAGRGDMNVTLGIPRLREILMTASANLKTPNMDIPFYPDIPDIDKRAAKLRQKLNRVTVADILEKIDVECEIVTEPRRDLKTTIRLQCLPYKQYKAQFCVKPKQILEYVRTKFFDNLFVALKALAKINIGMVWTDEASEKKSADDVENEAAAPTRDALSSDEEEANDDDDNTDVKIRNKRAEAQEYEDPESGEEEKSDEEDAADVENDEETKEEQPNKIEENDEVKTEVLNAFATATNYEYDKKRHQWCSITLLLPIEFLRLDIAQALRSAAAKSVIYQMKNVKRAITVTNKNQLFLKTEGINIFQMFQFHDYLDLRKLYSNDIHAIANTLGIEAACKVIIKEIQNVFNVYGITVNPRHLSLISDYMTFNGVFEPMSRKGMESSTSPLQQMSFESSLIFLKQAVLNARTDDIRSASSCLMLGQPCRSGTGCFDLRHAKSL